MTELQSVCGHHNDTFDPCVTTNQWLQYQRLARTTASLSLKSTSQRYCANPDTLLERRKEKSRQHWSIEQRCQFILSFVEDISEVTRSKAFAAQYWLLSQTANNHANTGNSLKVLKELRDTNPDLTGSCGVVLFSSGERALLHMQCSGLPALSHCVRQSHTGCTGHAHQLPGSKKENEG